MLLLRDIFSINRSRGYENPSLEIIVIEIYLTGGCPHKDARKHCSQNQSANYVVILISFECYCGDCSGYAAVILPFLAFYFCSAYFLYLVYYSIKSLYYFIKESWGHVVTWRKGYLGFQIIIVPLWLATIQFKSYYENLWFAMKFICSTKTQCLSKLWKLLKHFLLHKSSNLTFPLPT